eukprot:UN23318
MTIYHWDAFNATEDCEVLNKAMKGMGTDEDAITEIIVKRSNEQRQELKATFAQMFGKDLEDALKSELGGHYEDLILALFKKPFEYQASELHRAIKGAGTDESCLIEILCSRKSNEDLESIKEAYKKLYGDNLADDISSDTSGNFGRLLFSLVQAARAPDDYNDEEADEKGCCND